MMEGLELISFQIIAAAGQARSMYIEAVEIAKKYGQENSGAFVNAILGKIAKSNE